MSYFKEITFMMKRVILVAVVMLAPLAVHSYCHNCRPSPVSSGHSSPVYAPEWTLVTDEYGEAVEVEGRDVIRFVVKKDMTYRFTTAYGEQEGIEDYNEDFNPPDATIYCTEDSACSGYNMWCNKSRNECMPMGLKFDTELTLFKGGCCNPADDHCNAEYLGYNHNAIWQNQSMLEWKSDFDGEVFLLVTNNSCAESPEGIHTSVRWQRIDSSHCKECPYTGYKDDPDDYHICADGQPASETSPCDNWDSPDFAPDWLTIGGTNAIKAGDYQYYDVEKGKIYRWSTCTDPSFDTQFTLFRDGFQCDNTDHDAVFLAYNDDYPNCASGYFQSTLEWKSDFTGTVALLTNQYPCNYCKPGPEPDYHIKFNHCSWTTLDWQRSDCGNRCNNSINSVGSAEKPGIDPSTTSGVQHGDYMYFDLTEGAEYEFSTCVDFSGGSCDGTPGFDATLVLRKYDSDESCAGNVLKISRTSNECTGGCRGATITYKAPEDMKVELLVAGDDCEATGGTVDLKWLATDSPEFRYVEEEVDGDKCVADIYTLIWWYDPDENPANWEDALEFCDTLEYAGRDDWRLPDFNELSSIVDFDLTDPATGLSPFPSYGKTDTDEYWTSTTNLAVAPKYAWGIDLSNGKSLRLHKTDDERKFLCIARAKVHGELIAEKPAKQGVIAGWACDNGVYKKPGGGYQNNADEPLEILFYVFDTYGEPIEFKDVGFDKERYKYGKTDYTPSDLNGSLSSEEINEMTDKINFNCDNTAETTPHMYYFNIFENNEFMEKVEDHDPPYYVTVYAKNVKFGFIPVKTFKLLPEKEPFVLTDVCGDELVTGAEECDDGNAVTEECDYGEMSCLVCDSNCQWAEGETSYCGDETVNEPWEDCDEGDDTVDMCDEYNVGTCEVCDMTCSWRTIPAPYCGDGIHDGPGGDGLETGPEECDDGNDSNTDYCLNDCTLNECGNGHPNYSAGQTCDDGEKNGLYETECDGGRCCNETCDGYGPYCGDNNVDTGHEDCDDGEDNGLWRTYEEYTTDPGCNTTCDGPAPHCGDGKLQSSFEACDDGAAENEDNAYGKCSTDCQKRPQCGDGIIDGPGGEGVSDGPEICDDGVMNGHYGYCNSFCSGIAECGDGELQADHEECDWALVAGQPTPYAISEENSCTEDCETGSYCGDEVVDYGSHGAEELCDEGEGNISSGSYNTYEETCTTQCKWFHYCGDGNIDGPGGDGYTGGPEECDDGVNDGSYNGCSPGCESRGPYCGDGSVDSGYENCDHGGGNTDSPADYDACRTDCTQARCGDGITDNGEECDDGELNSNTVPGACRTDCTEPTCGDGVVDDGEECDDGNSNNNDSCTDECKIATCGDGFKKTEDSDLPGGTSQPPNETCDDGNTADGDYCSSNCQEVTGFCGDGDPQSNEVCDDGNNLDGDYCSSNCQEVTGFCGDGVQQSNEVCDDGNTDDGDYCSSNCQSITGSCGDGTVQINEACDKAEPGEGGGEGIGAYCSDNCETDLGNCGDGEIQYEAGESCDDGSVANGTYKRENPGHCDDDCKGTGEGGYCGDKKVQSDYEICDEGSDNGKYGNHCNATCEGYTGYCGDGTVQSAYEVCDDAENNGDYGYCNETCTGPAGFCGDGTVNSISETCDSGLASGLMAYFPFNGDTLDESPLIDEESSLPFSKIKHDGANYGALLTKDRKGATAKAYYFDGNNDYITLGNTDVEGAFENGSNAFTVSAWINPNSLGSTSSNHSVHNVFFAKASKSANDNLEIGVNPNGGIDVYLDTDGGNDTKTFHSGIIGTGDWYFVAVTFESGNIVKVYINGNLIVESKTFSGSSLRTAAGSPVAIGGTLHKDVYFNGKIDEVRIFNRAVPENQIGGLADWALEKTCNAQCQWNNYCGDGYKNGDEFCDSGGTNRDGWGLSKACNDTCSDWAPYCGDGDNDSEETCDDGPNNGIYGYCNNTCSGPGARCGDGTVQSIEGEECDNGGSNKSPGYYHNETCSTNCTVNSYCGDGVNDSPEVCDKGSANSDAYGNNCETDCSGYTGYCGDGIVQTSDEVCEKGDTETQDCTYTDSCCSTDQWGNCNSCTKSGSQSKSCKSDCSGYGNWSSCS